MDSLNTKTIGWIGAALAVLGAGIYFYQSAVEQKEQAGKSALYQIQKTFESEMNMLPEAQRATGVAFNVDEKLPKTVEALKTLLAKKEQSSRVMYEAAMKLGQLYLEHGNPDAAIGVFQQMPGLAQTPFQKASAYYLLGSSYERVGKAAEAAQSFQEGLGRGVEGLKGEFLYGLVRASVKQQQTDQAKKFVEQLKKDLPGSKALEAAEALVR